MKICNYLARSYSSAAIVVASPYMEVRPLACKSMFNFIFYCVQNQVLCVYLASMCSIHAECMVIKDGLSFFSSSF